MNFRKVKKLKRELRELRRKSAVTTGELESLASAVGRRKLKGAQVRGKEPMWVSDEFPEMRPISIPFHGRNNSSHPKTVRSILNDLEEDIYRLELKYDSDEDDIQEYEGEYEQ